MALRKRNFFRKPEMKHGKLSWCLALQRKLGRSHNVKVSGLRMDVRRWTLELFADLDLSGMAVGNTTRHTAAMFIR